MFRIIRPSVLIIVLITLAYPGGRKPYSPNLVEQVFSEVRLQDLAQNTLSDAQGSPLTRCARRRVKCLGQGISRA
jgi:hypothetical protein